MKRFSKLNNKKGFTLLETLLATCILVIISSMLMEGFITAMGYSYNSSVYSKSAAYNSKLCVDQLAEWSKRADGVASVNPDMSINDEDAPYAVKNFTSNSVIDSQLTFTGGLGTVKIAVYEEKNVDPALAAQNLTTFTAEKVVSNDNAVADNRTIFFYYPSNNAEGTSHYGMTNVYLQNGTTLVWGYDDPTQTNGVKVLGTKVKLQPES